MKTSNISFPHPVLGISNDVMGEYRALPTVSLGKETISLRIHHELSNPEYLGLIKSGRAKYCVEVHCTKTFFRQAFETDKVDQQITIVSAALRDRVELEYFVTAYSDINGFSLQGWHPDYQGQSFEIKKSALLAYGGKSSFMVETEWLAAKSVSSFMQVKKGRSDEGPMEIMLNSDPVIILLAKSDFEKFGLLNRAPKAAAIFHSALVLPAMIYALTHMITDKDQYQDCKWFQALQTRRENEEALRNLDWSLERVPEIAQTILRQPFARTLVALENVLSVEGDD